MNNLFSRIPNSLKNVSFVLVLVLGILFVGKTLIGKVLFGTSMMMGSEPYSKEIGMYDGAAGTTYNSADSVKSTSYYSTPVATEYFGEGSRKFQTDTSLSVVVKNVRDSLSSIESMIVGFGGFTVSKSVTTPEGLESGYISVRIPNNKVQEAKNEIEKLALKVVSESTYGNDITSEYVDIEERLKTYETTKRIYQDLLLKTSDFEQIMLAQDKIIQVQQSIDMLKGQQKYLDGIANTTAITISLSTDEYELSITPEKSFRPDVVAKNALRSLILNIRNVAYMGIWVAVYGLVVVPILGISWLVWKKLTTKK
jgi:hypothetical protein